MKSKPVAPACRVLIGRYISPEIRAQIAADAANYRSNLSKKKSLEQFYTKDHIAPALWAIFSCHVEPSKFYILDPCAGNAVFSRNSAHPVMALDVDPKHPAVIEANFLAVTVQDRDPIAVIGNPPFSLAVKFFNHAATMAEVIAMILPASFMKDAMQNRLDKSFHCVEQVRLPSRSFVHDGTSADIPAVFQVWIKRKEERVAPKPQPTTHPDFVFGAPDSADFAIRRIGARAGEIHLPDEQRGTSYFYIAVTSPARTREVVGIFRRLSLADVAKGNGRYRDISMGEIVALYSAALLRRASCHVAYELKLSDTSCRYRPTFSKPQRQAASHWTQRGLRRPEASSRCVVPHSRLSSGHCSATLSETWR